MGFTVERSHRTVCSKHLVHSCLIHIAIADDKIWIHRDGTGVAGDLLAAGVPKDRIVLGFYHPDTRKITDFAVC
ncbi:MAG: XisI protein [Hormoscilla sp. GM7CHS1pb]|nr:XisI protein [Hormoscilla sp. GM7CHS1pb]